MFSQCIVIALIIAALSIIFLRERRRSWAVATVPLMLIPLGNIIVSILFKSGAPPQIYTYGIAVSAVISCVWIGICAVEVFKGKRIRVLYIFVSLMFNLLLSLILISHYFKVLYSLI